MSETTKITYCTNGCRTNGNPIQTDPPDLICRRCDNHLHDWLQQIPNHYALLPTFIHHGTTDRNPDSIATKQPQAPAPMRLEIIDLLDTRRGRKWLGTAPTEARRGTLGTLTDYVNHLADTRHLTHIPNPLTVTAACALLQRHRIWLIQQDWITDLHADIKQLHRQLSDAIGEYRRPPVGACHIEATNGRCGGPLFANPHGGVRCARCSATWDAAHLRILGLAQAGLTDDESA